MLHRIVLLRTAVLLTLFSVTCVTSTAEAQSLFGGATGGANTGGQQTATQGAQGQSSVGTNTGQALGTTNLNAADGSLSATVGQGGFVGGQNNGTFTGNRFAGQSASQGTQAQFGNLQNNNRTQNRNNQTQTDRKPVRPQFRIAFPTQTIPQSEIQSSLTLNAINLPPIVSNSKAIKIEVDAQGLVLLTGTVSTDRERKLLESYVRMEPGVRNVKNEVTLAQ